MKIQLLLCVLLFSLSVAAQTQPPLPKHIITRPQANPRLITFSDVIVGKWRGARITQLTGAVNVDSLWLEFKKNGTLSFKHQKYEYNGPIVGTWTLSGNSIRIIADKFPFTHTLNGTWDINTGIISGTFSEMREKDDTQPTYYTPGSNSGSFNLSRY